MDARLIMEAASNMRWRGRAAALRRAHADGPARTDFARPRGEAGSPGGDLVALLASLNDADPQGSAPGTAAPKGAAPKKAARKTAAPQPSPPTNDAAPQTAAATPQMSASASQMSASALPDVSLGAAKPSQIVAKRRRLNERQESFCEHYVAMGNGAKAARFAGYGRDSARQHAHRLLTNADILQRIDELRRDLGARNRIDRETLMAKLEACFCGALSSMSFHAAVRAAEAQARLAGLVLDGRKKPDVQKLARPADAQDEGSARGEP